MARILVIDDDRSLCEVVGFILTEAGHEVVTANDGEAGLWRFDSGAPDLVLTDMRMPGPDGLQILDHVLAAGRTPPVPVIILTAYGTVEQAVDAMQRGAYTYLLKPFNRDELRLTVERALRAHDLEVENSNLRRLLRGRKKELPILYASAAMAGVVEQVRRIAASDASVLITGESGTGKELIAQALHDLSGRWDKPFVAVNCGAIPADLMEAELFGHLKGAFTGAHGSAPGRIRAADGGTLLLDEIGELPLPLQPKLLRVLETKSVDPVGGTKPVRVDFRLICASNRDLRADTAAGRFREDLYFRVDVVRLAVPPLRERPEDVPLLWDHFCRQHAGGPIDSSGELLERLQTLPWRGNVRELKNLSQRLVLMRRGDMLTERDLEQALAAQPPPGGEQGPAVAGLDAEALGAAPALPLGSLPPAGFSLAEMEKEIIRQALARCGGNKSRAAKYLKIPRHVLVYRLRKYGL
jgi:DNA-binding NtrC family response regulator